MCIIYLSLQKKLQELQCGFTVMALTKFLEQIDL
jgi:hypothetical protein